MGLKGELTRLRAALQGQLSYVTLANGSKYWYGEEQAFESLFLFGSECMKAGRVEDRPDRRR